MSGTAAALPPPGAALTPFAAIPEGGAVCVDLTLGEARWSVLVARKGGAVFGYVNRCPHARHPLERPDGQVTVQAGAFIVCAAHFASFSLETGAYVAGPGCGAGLTPAPVRVQDGVVVMGG